LIGHFDVDKAPEGTEYWILFSERDELEVVGEGDEAQCVPSDGLLIIDWVGKQLSKDELAAKFHCPIVEGFGIGFD
jgi:hypothetical protein